jgi:hypothetical protein
MEINMEIIAGSSIDRAHFKHIELQGDNWIEIAPRFGVTGSSLKDTAFEAVGLVDCARYFFAGWIPRDTYFADEFKPLPWCDEFATVHGSFWIDRTDLFAAAVSRVAVELGPVDPCSSPNVYDSDASEKTVLQGLAVETMLLADGCINLLLEAKVVAALPWLCAAYQRIMDCARNARDIVDYSIYA